MPRKQTKRWALPQLSRTFRFEIQRDHECTVFLPLCTVKWNQRKKKTSVQTWNHHQKRGTSGPDLETKEILENNITGYGLVTLRRHVKRAFNRDIAISTFIYTNTLLISVQMRIILEEGVFSFWSNKKVSTYYRRRHLAILRLKHILCFDNLDLPVRVLCDTFHNRKRSIYQTYFYYPVAARPVSKTFRRLGGPIR